MVFLVENGSGIQGANALVPVQYVLDYLTQRGRAAEFSGSNGLREAAVVAATDYVEKVFGTRFVGTKLFVFDEVPAVVTVTINAAGSPGDTLTIGGVAFDLDLGADLTAAALALAEQMDGEDQVDGADNAVRTATADGAVVTVELAAIGVMGNYVSVVASAGVGGDLTIAGPSGGLDGGSQFVSFPRAGIYDGLGRAVPGIPEPVRMAVAEYSSRAFAAALLPDPVMHESGRTVNQQREKVGPIETEYTFEDGGALSQLIKPYPAADKMLAPYLQSPGVQRW